MKSKKENLKEIRLIEDGLEKFIDENFADSNIANIFSALFALSISIGIEMRPNDWDKGMIEMIQGSKNSLDGLNS